MKVVCVTAFSEGWSYVYVSRDGRSYRLAGMWHDEATDGEKQLLLDGAK